MFPVPIAMPSIARSIPQRELNTCDLDDTGLHLRVRGGEEKSLQGKYYFLRRLACQKLGRGLGFP